MTQELKERIEQIRHGEVPEGYKKTKVGILPSEWEITKLNLISSHITNKNTNGEVQTTFTNSATQGVIKQTDYFDKEISSRESITSYYVVQENDYIYNPRISVSAPCGPINKSHFSDNGVVSPLYTVFKMNDGLQENKYIEFYFKSSLWYKYMCGVANYGARHDRMNITNDDLFGMPIPFPPLAEQEKIAEILSAQDKLIELQQKKIEELKKLKKVYLSKMFPKKGCNVPEVRFPGFTDTWEQRKLGEILQTLPFKSYLKAPEQDGTYEIVQQGNEPIIGYANGIPCDDFEGTVIFGDHTLSLYKPNKPFFVATDGVRIIKGKNEMVGDYLLPLLEKYKPQSEGYKRYYSILADKECLFTNDKDEQSQIGTYFRNLDNLITLHQRKLEEMKKLKKALMQLLLTGIVRV